MSGFLTALPFTLRMEGGYVDNRDDRGGPTNYGITQETFDRWNRARGRSVREVASITTTEAQDIYHAWYWVEGKCDALPWPVSVAHFDACVNHGTRRAARMLQEALGVKTDGKIGPKTLAAAEAAIPREILQDMLWVRLDFYFEISKQPSQLQFLRGWLRRTIHLREAYS